MKAFAASSRPSLRDIVWDAKVGSGDTDEEISKEKWARLEARWGVAFSAGERVAVKVFWEEFHREMMNP